MRTPMYQNQQSRNPGCQLTGIQNFIMVCVLVALLCLQGCHKNKCDDDPCAEGCGECPDICLTDPCDNPDICPEQCPVIEDGTLSRKDLKAEGNVVATDNGMSVDGKLTITTEGGKEVVLEDAIITVEYNDDGTVKSIGGKSTVPSPTDYIEITDPVQADLGYYTGKWLNENWDLDVTLLDERFYLAFRIAVALEMKVGANSDPNATKPLSIKPPVGGHILFIFDFTDPFYYYSAAKDPLGEISFGESFEGNIPYIPIQPVAEIVPFNGKSIRGGTFPIYKVIEVSGVLIRNMEFNVELVEEEPFPQSFPAGYNVGVNGAFDLSLPIRRWITFAIPVGEASAAVTAATGTDGIIAQAFVNGLAKPDNSWWPEIIPVKPAGQIRTSGYVQQDGAFDLVLSGDFNLELPSDTYSVEGTMGLNNEAFTMTGSVLANDLTWAAGAEFRKDETEFKAKPPQELTDNINSLVNANIDSAFIKAETALEDLEKAIADYEFELSLRGLRSVIPTIVSEAKKRIADGIATGIKSGQDQANEILSDEGLALCSDNIASQVNKLDDPYINALDRLNAAAAQENDNQTFRKEIEGALRDLAKLNRLKASITVTITAGNKEVKALGVVVTPKCTVKSNFTRPVSIDVEVLTNEQVALLNQASDNVKYIAATSDIRIEAQEIFDRIPAQEILEQVRSDLETGTKTIPSIEEVGFINHHHDDSFSFYWIVNGEQTDLEDVNIFDPASLANAIIRELTK